MSELRTPLTAWHEAHGAKMAPFAGWLMPIQYEGILAEHQHTRRHAGLFDICHMGEFLVEGPGADAALPQAVSHNLQTLAPGKCRYGFILNEAGGVLDDGIIYRFGPDSFMAVVNAACAADDFATLRARLPESVRLTDISAATAKVDLQGPESLAVLEQALGENFHDLGYFAFRRTRWQGEPLLVSRTGYTGELGYELYLPAARAVAFWECLLADARVRPAGLGARDTLRLEAGLPLYGHDLDAAHTPAEAGMGRMLTSAADYVGKAGAQTVRQVLTPLALEGRRAARHGDALTLPDGTPAGRVTSGSFAPSLGHGIALAWVDAAHAEAAQFVIQAARTALPAVKADLPFYKNGTARQKLA
ncbi:glycine cleavage system aminomethyltransferase GcvT [Desulfovibrio legallii]|uniref:aminomethyltransferase n=1 Tax=Desulfovibrio legallii TaxID=571438 RepID=A0A1G7I411_9BACT|nr:glycine cleavage system aminomethyltransferase GcvT [Desulfovibrio legallii]SDF07328.1 aminomethyltransferase [Desulfovibrio legallii]